jgi:hypothetical protein
VGFVLKVAGRSFDVDAYLRRGVLVPTAVYRRGEARFPTLPRARKSLQSGFSIVVSKKSLSDFAHHTEQAVTFLRRHRHAVGALRRRKGVESAILELALERRPESEGMALVFPEELVRLAGALGLALEVSFYPPSDPTRRPLRRSNASDSPS